MKDDVFVIGDCHGHINELLALVDKAQARREGVEIIQLGDLGHFGTESAERDYLCYEAVGPVIDLVLWGNHDRAVIDPHRHGFHGFQMPSSRMKLMMGTKPVALAVVRHGFIITHAGIHPKFQKLFAGHDVSEYPRIIMENENDDLVNSIGRARGGWQSEGGILWRDYTEDLMRGCRQIYGHSRDDEVRVDAGSYCIDICPREGGKLAGIWLPSQNVVTL
jgi:hypothetical protein